jgi:hypothetical protein
MPSYSLCRQNLFSNIALPELHQARQGGAGLYFALEAPAPQREYVTWQHEWQSAYGVKELSYKKRKDGHLLRFPALADFYISFSAKVMHCHPAPGVPLTTVRHLLLDQALPRCLAQRGMVMLHASAVSLPQGLVLFIGRTGEGKSTLAGYFHQAGNAAVSDDCVRILEDQGTVRAIPSYSGLRFWEDSRQILFPSLQGTLPTAHYSSKARVQVNHLKINPLCDDSQNGYPVLAVIILSSKREGSEAREVQLAELPRRQAFIEMMKQTFQLDVTDHHRFQNLVLKMGSIIHGINTYQLTLPHEYNLLPLVRELIIGRLTGNH